MAIYQVVLHVGSQTLPTLLSIIDNNADIRLKSVSDTAGPEPLPPSPPPPAPSPSLPPSLTCVPPSAAPSRFVGGKKDKGVRGEALVLETLRAGPASLDELKRTFVNRNFAATSTPGYVSRLLKAGQIRRGLHGRFALNTSATNGKPAS